MDTPPFQAFVFSYFFLVIFLIYFYFMGNLKEIIEKKALILRNHNTFVSSLPTSDPSRCPLPQLSLSRLPPRPNCLWGTTAQHPGVSISTPPTSHSENPTRAEPHNHSYTPVTTLIFIDDVIRVDVPAGQPQSVLGGQSVDATAYLAGALLVYDFQRYS